MFEFGIYSNNGYPEIPDICPDNSDIVSGHSGLQLGVSGTL